MGNPDWRDEEYVREHEVSQDEPLDEWEPWPDDDEVDGG